MKKTLQLLVFTVLLQLTATAQLSVPNGGMENWTNMTYNSPDNYIQTSNMQAFYQSGAAFNCERVADPYHGNYAIKLTTVLGTIDTAIGYFINGNASGPPNSWRGGIPYNQQATGIHGYYKSAIPVGDVAHIIVDFKLAGSSIGFYVFDFTGTQSNYTPFQFNFMPALAVAPDTIIFGATSSDIVNNTNIIGSMIQLDSITFTGVTSQPALLNGDFENWTSQTLYSLNNWYQNSGGNNGSGVQQTTDAAVGTYALELTTTLGSGQGGTPRAQSGMEGTGYYICQNGGGMCALHGGYPFANQIDTLCFNYKYAPATITDTAQVYLVFKYNGSQTWGTGMPLTASANYQYIELPFNTFGSVDTAIVMFQSTNWQDSLLSAIGSDLKVDNVHFKTQNLITGVATNELKDGVFIAPNPFTTSTTITFAKEQKNTLLQVVDILGNIILETTVNTRQYTIDMNGHAKGVYFVEITDANNVKTNRKIVVQ